MLSGVFAMGKFPGGFTSNANDADGSGNPRHHSGRSPMNRSGGGSSSSSATFSNREVDGFHAQGEVAMLDLLEYDGAASYHKISDKDKCVLYECSSSSSTTTTVTEDTYSVKGVHTICTHMSEVMELLSAKSQYFSSVLTKLLGPIHADNSPLFPVDTHSIDEHALLIVYLALQSSSTAAMNNDLASASHFRTKATAAGHITREYCFLRYCGYFTNNNEAGRMERVLPSEPLRPQSQAVSVWDSIASAQSCTPHGPIGRLIKTGFILEQAKAPNAVKVNFIMSMHPHNYANSRQLASEKLFLQRMVRTMLLNVSAAVMELRLLTDHLLLKTSWTDSPMCTICLKNFSLLRRKHHCRLCGDAFCTTCSLTRARPDLGDSVRVCHACVEGNPSSLVRSSEKLFSTTQPSHLFRHASMHGDKGTSSSTTCTSTFKGRALSAGGKKSAAATTTAGWSLSGRGRSPKETDHHQTVPSVYMQHGGAMHSGEAAKPPPKKAQDASQHEHPMEGSGGGRRLNPSDQPRRNYPAIPSNPLAHHQYDPFRDGPRSIPSQQVHRRHPDHRPLGTRHVASPRNPPNTLDNNDDNNMYPGNASPTRRRGNQPTTSHQAQPHSPPRMVREDNEDNERLHGLHSFRPPTVLYDGSSSHFRPPQTRRGLADPPLNDDDEDHLQYNVPDPVVLDQDSHPSAFDFDLRHRDHHHHPHIPPSMRTTPPTPLYPDPQPEPPVDDTSQFLYHSTPFSYPLNFYNGNAWPDAPVTASEDERMERARDLDLLRRRDDILMYVRIAAKTLKCPVATLCIVGGQAGLLIAKVGGVTTDTIPRQVMLESHAILSPEPTVVLDCLSDLRFATNPLVCEGDIGIRFYVGMPLCTSDGLVLGVLSLVDTQPRDRVRIAELQKLRQVTDTVMHRFEDLSVGTTKTRWDQQAAFQRQCEMDLELD
ncbi:hypothetical protein, variant [Aphanomyces astaci]|nr:hypothetical protein, variant [Aphanomyces astaci]ETV82221.1 hypothetical protein, variant [Aphanomyces astaci]|eukprot:XP_009827890.1 hypothetical protein, variant [Aphanomyces astaci]